MKLKNKVRLLFVIVLLLGFAGVKAQVNNKPRVIVMTDGEIDDQSSMIRFLLYSCDVDVLAIIETNSVYQKNGHSKENWYEKQLEAYEHVYPNLIIHNTDYPTVEKLRKISYVGDEDYDHLKNLGGKSQRPGAKVVYNPDDWADTPGSDRIVEVLLDKNPDPVYIQAWGGGNTAARAFYKLKTAYPNDYIRAVSKAIMYNIIYQDGAGNYIENNHPKVTMLFCGSFNGTWDYNSQKITYDFIKNNVKNNHGQLGKLYPQDYVSEGDSPSFLYTVNNGLRNYMNPAYGGWGGRFEKFHQFENVFVDAKDDDDRRKPLSRWIGDANNNFQARMDWCISSSYEKANHSPLVKVTGRKNLIVKSGKNIKLNARKSSDPDQNDIQFSWWQYKEAGSYKEVVKIQDSESVKSHFIAPVVIKPETIHIILKVTDNGSPALCTYERIIFTIVP